jgi:hypothetical protein
MDPLRAALTHARADYWTDLGILTAQDLMRPFVVLIQPETEFAMNLPERLA